MTEFILERQKAVAYGQPVGSGSRPKFLVKAGSTAMRNGSPRVKRKAELTDELARTGILVPHNSDPNLWVFAKDYIFSSPSAAGDIINDGNLSAPQYWRDTSTGETLKVWLAKASKL